jgi:hypothetical protein
VAKFRCVCGEVIRTSGEIPNPIEWHCIPDAAFDDVASRDAESLYRASVILYRCPRSDHLWAVWDGIESPPSLTALKGCRPPGMRSIPARSARPQAEDSEGNSIRRVSHASAKIAGEARCRLSRKRVPPMVRSS